MAALNIPRLEGEDEADYQRRYVREKMRIYRARKPKGPKRFRGKNKAPPKNSSATSDEWLAAQQRSDETDEQWERRRNREKVYRHRRAHAEELRERRRARYPRIRELEAERNRIYREANAEKVKAAQAVYYRANKEKRIGALKAWGAANAERLAESKQRWYEENQALRNAYSAAWRKAARDQTPPWADWEKTKAIYEEAIRISEETGIPQHVDHFYPLRGETVSGLHVHTNLRIIPALDNMRKRNKLLEE